MRSTDRRPSKIGSTWRALSWAILAAWQAGGGEAARAQTTVYLRSGWPPGVDLSNCTNARPVVCTTAEPHQLSAGDQVVISNVVGNTAVNGARKVGEVLSPTRFSLAGLDGNPLAGNGAWSPGGTPEGLPSRKLVGRAQPYALAPHPRVLLDGTQGKFARRLRCAVSDGCLASIQVSGGVAVVSIPGGHELAAGARIGVWNGAEAALNGPQTITGVSPDSLRFETPAPDGTYTDPALAVSQYAFAGNPAWDSMKALVDDFAGSYQVMNANPTMERYLAAAFVWYTDRQDDRAFAMARWAINHAEDSFYGTGACLENDAFCGGRTGTDYIRFNAANIATIYSLLLSADQLSAEERQAFAGKMLNDVDTACTVAPVQTGAGTIAAVGGETTISGTGTQFTKAFARGDSIFLPSFGNEDYVNRIESVQSDTQMTVSRPIGWGHSGTYQHARAWRPGDCGAVFIMKHHSGSVVGDPANYPTRGSSEASYFHNLALTSLWSYVQVGLALAEDRRGQTLLEAAWLYGYDNLLGYAMSSWTGLTQSGSGYHWYRTTWMAADLAFAAKYAFQGFPDLIDSSPYWLSDVLPLTYYSFMPFGDYNAGTAFGPLFGEGSLTVSPYWLSYQARLVRLFETTPEARAWRWWLKNRYGYTGATIGENFSQGAVNYYLGVNPNLDVIDNSTLPTQYVFDRSGYDNCAGLGMAQCIDPERKYAMAVSRGDWTSPSASELQIYAGTYEPDHFENEAGDYRIVKGQAGSTPCLVGGDSLQCAPAFGGLQQTNLLEIGEGYARRSGQGDPPISGIPRWAGERPAGDPASRYLYALVDLTGVFKTSYGVQRAHRHFVHFKQPEAPEEIVAVYDDVSLTTPARIQAYTHFSQNGEAGEGATTCPGARSCQTTQIAAGRLLSQSTTNTLVTQYLSPRASTRFRLFVERPDGGYTGGNAHSFRVSYCATTDDTTCSKAAREMETLIVHRLASGVGDTELTATLLSPSEEWTGVQTASTVTLLARHGALLSGIPPFATTHQGLARYVAAGLAPGLYDVVRDGITLLAAQVVAEGDTSIYFEGAAGVYLIRPAAETGDPSNAGAPPGCVWPLSAPVVRQAAGSGATAAAAMVRFYASGPCTEAADLKASAIARAAAPVSTRALAFSYRPMAGADNVLLEWGTSPEALNQTQTTGCARGCTLKIVAAPGASLYVRASYRAGQTVRGSDAVRLLRIP